MGTRLRAVVFDLDGTLVDSAIAIASALDRVRARRGATTPVDRDSVRNWVSLGAAELVRNAMADTGTHRDTDVAEFRAEYAAIPTPPGSLYPGAVDTLEWLARSGVALGICSNKPQHLCLKVLEECGIGGFFTAVTGGDVIANSKPHPDHLLATLAVLEAGTDETVYLGDSSVDLRASLAARVPFVLAAYGYADPALAQLRPPDLQGIASLAELPGLLASGYVMPRHPPA